MRIAVHPLDGGAMHFHESDRPRGYDYPQPSIAGVTTSAEPKVPTNLSETSVQKIRDAVAKIEERGG